jgi:dienelactone hydrolase
MAAVALSGVSCLKTQAAESDVTFLNEQGYNLKAKLYTVTTEGRHPAVILLHGCGGMYRNATSPLVGSLFVEWANRLNDIGYHAIVVESFESRGVARDQCNNGNLGPTDYRDRPVDAAAAADYLNGLNSVDNTKIGVLGWSHGGSGAMAVVDTTNRSIRGSNLIKAAVAFYPGCGFYSQFGGITKSTWYPEAPLLVLSGAIDPLYTSGYCDKRITRAKDAAAKLGATLDLSIIAYAGAKHGFDRSNTADTTAWTEDDLNAKALADVKALLFLRKYLD